MVQVHAGFLAASGGPAQQLEALGAMGLGQEGVRALLVARPQVLLEKPAELLRKHAFLVDVLNGDLAKHPEYLCHSLMHTIGPRCGPLAGNCLTGWGTSSFTCTCEYVHTSMCTPAASFKALSPFLLPGTWRHPIHVA
jgi:hypothetical protein